MTEKRTLALNARQWRVLLNDNLDVLKAAVHQTETIDEGGLREFYARLEDMKMLAGAWFQVSVPPVKMETVAHVQPNGAAVPVKKRGRKSNAERAAMAAQGMQ